MRVIVTTEPVRELVALVLKGTSTFYLRSSRGRPVVIDSGRYTGITTADLEVLLEKDPDSYVPVYTGSELLLAW